MPVITPWSTRVMSAEEVPVSRRYCSLESTNAADAANAAVENAADASNAADAANAAAANATAAANAATDNNAAAANNAATNNASDQGSTDH